MKLILLVGAAGFSGTLLRFFCVRGADKLFPGFPWGTLCVNVAGAFAAGFLFVVCRSRFAEYEAYFPVVFLGFLGAFTTFSTFALESSRFLLHAEYTRFFCNILLQNGSGILACCAGFLLAQLLFR